jgi:hypothetical protein
MGSSGVPGSGSDDPDIRFGEKVAAEVPVYLPLACPRRTLR